MSAKLLSLGLKEAKQISKTLAPKTAIVTGLGLAATPEDSDAALYSHLAKVLGAYPGKAIKPEAIGAFAKKQGTKDLEIKTSQVQQIAQELPKDTKGRVSKDKLLQDLEAKRPDRANEEVDPFKSTTIEDGEYDNYSLPDTDPSTYYERVYQDKAGVLPSVIPDKKLVELAKTRLAGTPLEPKAQYIVETAQTLAKMPEDKRLEFIYDAYMSDDLTGGLATGTSPEDFINAIATHVDGGIEQLLPKLSKFNTHFPDFSSDYAMHARGDTLVVPGKYLTAENLDPSSFPPAYQLILKRPVEERPRSVLRVQELQSDAYNAALARGESKNFPFDPIVEIAKRELDKAVQEDADEVWFAIKPEGIEKLQRAKGVQKNYHLTVAPKLEKLAKRLGVKVRKEGGYIMIPTAGLGAIAAYGEDLDSKCKELEAQGFTPEEIDEVLAEATNENISNNKIPTDLEAKRKELLAQGFTSQEIDEVLAEAQNATQNLQSEGPDQSVSNQNLEAIGQPGPNQNNSIQAKSGDDFDINQGQSESVLDPKQDLNPDAPPEEIHRKLQTIYRDTLTDVRGLAGFVSDEQAAKAAAEEQKINSAIVAKMNQIGYDNVKLNEQGEIVKVADDGLEVPLDVPMLQQLWDQRGEIGLAVSGAIAGARTGAQLGAPGGPLGIAVGGGLGAVVGGAAGAAFGRFGDSINAMLEAKQDIDMSLAMDRAVKAGLADALFSALGAGAFNTVKWSARGLRKASDLLLEGNKEGAYKALKDVSNLNDEQIKEIITDWERMTGAKARGHHAAQAIRAFIETQPGSEHLISQAVRRAKTAGSGLSATVDDRAKQLLKEVSNLTNENVADVLQHRLPEYRRTVQEGYQGVKTLGVDLMKDQPYRFDFSKLAIKPITDDMYQAIVNPAKRRLLENYVARIKQLGAAQARAKLQQTADQLAEQGIKVKQFSDKAIEAANPLRDFENLLELRRVMNQFKNDSNFSSVMDYAAVNRIVDRIDKEIAHAAKEYMPEGEKWLKEWRKANIEYGKMKKLEQNVLYKALTSPRANPDKIVKALAANISNTNGTFMEVLGKLPPNVRNSAEGAVLKHLTEKFTKGDEAGKQAVDFVKLASELENIPFTTAKARQAKRLIQDMAKVFKNDPALQHVLGANVGVQNGPSIATSIQGKAHMEVVHAVYNALKTRVPFSSDAQRRALVNQVVKVLDNPTKVQEVSKLKRFIGNDPELNTALKQLAITYAKYGEPENYTKVPVYRVAKPGQMNKATSTKWGKGVLYFTSKAKADQAAKQLGAKVKVQEVPPRLIATPEDISRILGREVSPEEFKSKQVQDLLRDKDYLGLAIDDKVILF